MESKNKQTIYIYNLPKSATEEDLLSIFGNFGKILSCNLTKHTDSAYIEFDKESSADRALDMDNVEMGSTQVRVVPAFTDRYTEAPITYTLSSKKIDYSNGIQIFVGDIGYNVDESMLTEKFSQFGSIFDTKVVRMPDGKHRGFAFISFHNESEAEAAIQSMNNSMFHNRKIKCNWASKKKQSQPQQTSPNRNPRAAPMKTFEEISIETTDTNTSVYVTGDNLLESVIRPCFERFGYIRSIKAFPEKNHAFVNYECHDAAAHAILQLNGYTIGDTTMKCAWGKKGAANETDKQLRLNSSPNAQNQHFIDFNQQQHQFNDLKQQKQTFVEYNQQQQQQPQYIDYNQQQQMIDIYQNQQQQQHQNYPQQYFDVYQSQQFYGQPQADFFQQCNAAVGAQPQQQQQLPIDYYNNLQMQNFYLQQQHQQQQQQQRGSFANRHQQNGAGFQSHRFFK